MLTQLLMITAFCVINADAVDLKVKVFLDALISLQADGNAAESFGLRCAEVQAEATFPSRFLI